MRLANRIIIKCAVLFTCCLVTVGGGAYASETVKPSNERSSIPLIQFSLKPRLCVLSEGEAVCRDTIEIKWTAKQARSLCLYKNDDEQPLRCWDSVAQGAHVIELAASQNIDFSLREKNRDTYLVTQAFEVVQQSTNYRRRNRNPWSFF